MEFKKVFKKGLISFVFICSTAANAGTVLMPTDGDVNFFVADPFPYSLAIFDDTDFGGTALDVILEGPPILGILLGGTINFSNPPPTATNTDGDTLNFAGGNNHFMVGLWDGSSWIMDSGAAVLPANAVELSFDVGGNVLTVDVAVVPVPAAVWLFGSGLLGLVGVARRRS